MRSLIVVATVLVALALGSWAADRSVTGSDVALRAMLDEMERSKTLHLNDLDKPYFIRYAVSDAEQVSIIASLGGVLSSNHVRLRSPHVDVRVGDYKFDNTNSIYSGSARLGLFPLDDNYLAMRADLWLSTDGLYKAATEQITRKRAALREMADPDKTDDFATAKPSQVILPVPTLNLDQKSWEQTVQKLSTRFVPFPDVTNSRIRLITITSAYRLVDSEGTIVRIPQNLSAIEITSSGLAPDGSRVWNHDFVTALSPLQLPKPEELEKKVQNVAEQTEALTKAPLSDDYTGPVLFEQEAAAEMVAQVFTDAIRLQRKPVAPLGSNNPGTQAIEGVWSSRLGSKVMPDWLSVFDDPAEEKFKGAPLVGQYQVDDEGVHGERVSLVEKGTLKGFLLSRQPVRDFKVSNGHGRLPGGFGAEAAVIGNLFVQADQSVSEAQLKSKLLEKVKNSNAKYGMIIRRMDFPSTANFQELQSMARQLQKNGYARTLNSPLLAYRLYPDGREELVRGMRFKEFSARDLRDIEAASDHPYVLNYVNNGSSLNLAEGRDSATTSSVVCPSLLFDSIDLGRADTEANRLPVVPAPALVTQ